MPCGGFELQRFFDRRPLSLSLSFFFLYLFHPAKGDSERDRVVVVVVVVVVVIPYVILKRGGIGMRGAEKN